MKNASDFALQISRLSTAFGALKVPEHIDQNVHPGEIADVPGPNRTGKAMLMDLLTGAYQPSARRVFLMGHAVTSLATTARCRQGLGRIEGALTGALLFFVFQTAPGAYGAWYLTGLGVTSVVFALFLPGGLWGPAGSRLPDQAIPTGHIIIENSTTSRKES